MLFEAKKFYYQIQYQNQKLRILKEVKGHFEKAVDKIEEKYDEGEEDISQSEITKLKLGLAGTLNDIYEVETDLQISRLSLSESLGNKYPLNTELLEPDIVPVAFEFDNFFTGEEVGLFGGLSYQHRKLPLTFILEFNPDEYKKEQNRGSPAPESQISAGLKWDHNPNTSITISRKHNQEWGINLALKLDAKKLPQKQPKENFISSKDLPVSMLPEQLNKNMWYDDKSRNRFEDFFLKNQIDKLNLFQNHLMR